MAADAWIAAARRTAALLVMTCGSAQAGAPQYQLVGSFLTPGGAQSRTVLGDGRMAVMIGSEIHVQDALHGSTFSRIGLIDSALINSFGASFLAFSPDGSMAAIGDGNFGPGASVHFVDASSLDPNGVSAVSSVQAANFEGHWHTDGRLYVSGGDFTDSFVSVIDNVRGAPSVTRLVEGVGGASAGVTVRDGWLYTANGFDFAKGGSMTGDVRAFDLAAITTGSAANFETDGVLVASALSGNSLGFDAFGNMLVGGGDFANPNEFGFQALIDGAAILDALGGLGAAGDGDEQRLSPAGESTYSALYNDATGEVLVWAFADGVVYRYAIPAPGGVVLLGGILGAAWRRRRG